MKGFGRLLSVAGGVVAGLGLLWATVIGYYPSQVPALLATLAVGVVMLFIGSSMVAATKPTKVEWQPASPAVSAAPASAPAPVAAEVVDDGTVAVPRRRRRVSWSISFPDGSDAFVREAAIVGRAPQPLPQHPGDDVIVIDDPSVSKTHVRLVVEEGVLRVLDLESANGTLVIVDGVEFDCRPGEWILVPNGAVLALGTVDLRCASVVRREVVS